MARKDERLYRIWKAIRTRTHNDNISCAKYYSKKHIELCNEWNSYLNFKEWALNNGYNDNLTIDRIDGNKGYSPSNCRWADSITQNNNRSNNIKYDFKGEKLTINQIAKKVNINSSTLRKRIINSKMTLEEAINYKKGFNPRSKPVIQYDLNMNKVKEWENAYKCRQFGFDNTHIGKCCEGKERQHKGFIWKYKEEI